MMILMMHAAVLNVYDRTCDVKWRLVLDMI